MAEAKFENMLNVSLDVSRSEREKSIDLDTGVDEANDLWEIIVKHTGSITFLEEVYDRVRVTELLNGYAVCIVPQNILEEIPGYVQIEYVEKPKQLYFQDVQSFSEACILSVKGRQYDLHGEGIITAIIDSGINIQLPEFRNRDGSTRIVALWDQTARAEETDYYGFGREYDSEAINEAIAANAMPAADTANHGTPVAALACGNTGVADKSEIIIVKLATASLQGFPRTTQIMLGIDYVLRKAVSMGKPVAINLSIGNNYGSHLGNSLLERYIDDASRYWKSVICVGSGNEAAAATHQSGRLLSGQEQVIEFTVSSYQTAINLQIWKSYADEMLVSIITPDGRQLGPLTDVNSLQRFSLSDMTVLGYLGQPTPYSVNQEIFFEFIPQGNYITSGIWQVLLQGQRVVEGGFDLWLPSNAALNEGTGFLQSVPENTITIPSTTQGVISVGAYNGRTEAYAPFSGRGRDSVPFVKPDIVAPGVNVASVSNTGTKGVFSGTSFATPIVTGSAALLMEWGIVRGNDAFLYGEKVKAYLLRGARQLRGFDEWPNGQLGWGALCLDSSIIQKT